MDYKNNIYESEYRVIGTDIRYALPHHDDSIEIIQTWSDGGHFIVKNNIFPIKPGNIILINAIETHYSNPTDPSIYNRSKLIVSTSFFKSICQLCNLEEFAEKNIFECAGSCFSMPINIAQNIDSHFQTAANHFHREDDEATQPSVVLAIISILTSILSNATTNTLHSSTRTIEQLALYVNKHSNDWENISLDSICNSLHISESRASHLFKDLTGKTIIQYKNELRITEAKKLLLSTNLKVFEISDMLDFQHCTIFCKYFKDMVGCTPKKYRDSKGLSIRVE